MGSSRCRHEFWHRRRSRAQDLCIADYAVRSWAVPVRNESDDGRQKLDTFDKLVASVLPQTSSSDAYLYGSGNGNGDGLCLGVTLFETSEAGPDSQHGSAHASVLAAVLGAETIVLRVNDIGVFETDMYMSRMHGGHGGGKTSILVQAVRISQRY